MGFDHCGVVLLTLRNTIKAIEQTPAELVYGTTLRLPDEYFHPAPAEPQPPELVAVLRESMNQLRYSPGMNHHTQHAAFVPVELDRVSHVFVRIDAVKTPQQPRYEGPFAVLERREKVFKVQRHTSTTWISVDRLKPAFIALEDPVADHTYAVSATDVDRTSPCDLFSAGGVIYCILYSYIILCYFSCHRPNCRDFVSLRAPLPIIASTSTVR
jgi:hypothetical protein